MIDRPHNINIFILYAAGDEALKNELESHLSLLHHHGYVDVWHEGKIEPGAERAKIVSEYMRKAHVILLLISANFLAPDCYTRYEEELRLAYERQQRGEVKIIPVILRHCIWQFDILADLNPLPRSGHPVGSNHWENRDKAFHEIALSLQRITGELMQVIQAPPAAAPAPAAPVAAPPPQAAPAPSTPSPPTTGTDRDAAAHRLLSELLDLLRNHDPQTSALRAAPLIHSSLLRNGALEASFKKNNFIRARERAELYKNPIHIVESKPTRRTTIGLRGQKEAGQEVKYTIARQDDLGGLPGHIRVFFPHDGGPPKISGITL